MNGNHIPTNAGTDGLVMRRLDGDDRVDGERLEEPDSRPAPDGGRVGSAGAARRVAAISLAPGESIADPFSRTGERRALLELRVAQLRRRENGRRRHLRLLRPKARAALAVPRPG